MYNPHTYSTCDINKACGPWIYLDIVMYNFYGFLLNYNFIVI